MNTNEKITALADEAKALLKKGANNLTEDEAKRLMKLYNDTKGLVAQGIKDNVKAATAALEGNGTTAMGKQYLNIKALADALPRSVRQYTSLHKVEKGITSEGSTLVQVPLVNTTPVPGSANVEIPPRLVSYLPTVVRTAPVYDALIEVEPDDAGGASVVAPGEQKQVSKLGIKRVEQRLHVIATLSEPIDKFTLQDAANLDQWVGVRLTDKVMATLEAEVLDGNGTGEHLTGLSAVDGIQTQDYDGNQLDTLAAALTKLETIGVSPTLVVLSPADWLSLRTAKDATARYVIGDAINATARTIWGTQVVVSAALDKGTAYVIGADALAISTDGNVSVEWNPYSQFGTNQTIARVEGRYNLDVFSPQRIVRATLSAGE